MSTDNVIPFPTRRVVYRNDPPLFIIEIYAGERNSFSWVVITEDPMHSPDTEELSEYLGDMFLALNPQPPGILERLHTFFKRHNPFSKGQSR